MTKKAVFLISHVFLAVAVAISMGVCNAYAIGHYGIPGTYLGGCDVCHDFIHGVYEPTPEQPGTGNLRWVKSTIEWNGIVATGVIYTKISEALPADGTLADGNNSKLDGPCEVCHTTTTYHNRYGDPLNPRHYAGQDCTTCHPHFKDNMENYFEPTLVGPQSHATHLADPKGPHFDSQFGDDACIQCHNAGGDFSLFADGQDLDNTGVCDDCHSPGGAFNGSLLAKAKWENGVYEANGTDLQAGNENWCASCHDSGTSTMYGVDAPNVAGDNSSWGYNITGHGYYDVSCEDCHDLAFLHIDGVARTYSATAVPNNYQSGYRLNESMSVPRNGEMNPVAFRLCTTCHLYTDITGPQSGFRDDAKGLQFHDMHLSVLPATYLCADSDFSAPPNCFGFTEPCVDSALTCVSCHNVHGAPNPAMIRHGELMSTPGTSDKEPAFDMRWAIGDGTTPTTVFEESRYGFMKCGAAGNLTTNHSCFGCHGEGTLTWYRNPAGQPGVTLNSVWTTDTSDLFKTEFDINPPQAFRVHARFTLVTTGTKFVKITNSAVGNNASMAGPDWYFYLNKAGNVGSGTYEVQWQGTIPATAGNGSPAKVIMRIYVFDTQGGTLLYQDEATSNFTTVDLP
jgi:hypothetical protein